MTRVCVRKGMKKIVSGKASEYYNFIGYEPLKLLRPISAKLVGLSFHIHEVFVLNEKEFILR
jgi:hypothetical protein